MRKTKNPTRDRNLEVLFAFVIMLTILLISCALLMTSLLVIPGVFPGVLSDKILAFVSGVLFAPVLGLVGVYISMQVHEGIKDYKEELDFYG